jgi:hypothetical protein
MGASAIATSSFHWIGFLTLLYLHLQLLWIRFVEAFVFSATASLNDKQFWFSG